jgi:hypothetical protein
MTALLASLIVWIPYTGISGILSCLLSQVTINHKNVTGWFFSEDILHYKACLKKAGSQDAYNVGLFYKLTRSSRLFYPFYLQK